MHKGLISVFFIALVSGLIVMIWENTRTRQEDRIGEIEDEDLKIDDTYKYMRNLAAAHILGCSKSSPKKLLRKSKRNWHSLKAYYRYIRDSSERLLGLVPSAQWLIDNYYVINRETKIILQNYNLKSCGRIPTLKNSTYEHYPRIYSIAREMVKITSMHIDEDTVVTLLNEYQKVKPLYIAELWAFSNILKITLIEYIGIISKKIVESVRQKQNADRVIDEILQNSWSQTEEIIPKLINKLKSAELLSSSFIAQILYRLREMDLDNSDFERWLTGNPDSEARIVSEIFRKEASYQAMLQVKMSSAVTSLIEVSAIDWEKLFEKVSVIEKIFSKDPSGVYPKMDFATKNMYHREVEDLAGSFNAAEAEIAEKVIEICCANTEKERKEVFSHVGYYLIGKGKYQLERLMNRNNGLAIRIKRWFKLHKGIRYFFWLFLITALILLLTVTYALKRKPDIWWAPFGALIFFIGILSITLALEIVNYIFTKYTKPTKLPCMDFEKSIPDEYRTIVVIPVILDSVHHVKEYVEKMEAYFLSNRDKNLFFAILGDFKDAGSKEMPEDNDIVNAVIKSVKELNQKYAGYSEGPFYFFHRYRKWNDKQGCWMGWERKRGKLEEFNRLLNGDEDTSYNIILGNTNYFSTFKYVITIDADTELTNGSASKLIGIMAHPLNRPVMDEKRNRIIEGYTLLQPRVGVRVNFANASFFSRIFAGQAGIDPYINAVSDVYQDVFGEGSFAGKGIYDIRFFHQILGEAIPENSVLSHDLLEGCYVRCAMATQVMLMDGYPSTVESFFRREHRWIRGDWQLLPWLFGRGSLKFIYRWKILDNMRRSLVPFSQWMLIIMGLLYLNWNYYVLLTLIFSGTLFSLAVNIWGTIYLSVRRPTANRYISGLPHMMATIFKQGFLLFILIPYRAYISLDAIIRTLFRLLISHKNMLEWKTAEAVEKTLVNSLKAYIKRMWIGPLSGLLLIFAPGTSRYAALSVALLWLASPGVGYLVSLPFKKKRRILLDQLQIQDLRDIARKTWRYFEEFFSEQDNWLTPDNYQEYPGDVLAHRTSPTNIGMQALSTLCARDFGYIGINRLVKRLEKLFNTISKMETWHGYLYNWYDTRTLNVLYPKYVSTVDSGNFLASLIVLKNGLEEIKNKPIFSEVQLKGLLDAARLAGIEVAFKTPGCLQDWKDILNRFIEEIKLSDNKTKNNEWINLLYNQCNDYMIDIGMLVPMQRFESPPSLTEVVDVGNSNGKDLLKRINKLIEIIEKKVRETDFRALYDISRNLFRVGYNVSANFPDSSHYDLLASESRLTSFIAIAKGDIPRKHWFKLGRPLTLVNGKPVLVSWSGTMFEYLLPSIYMRELPGTMLSQTCYLAAKAQIEYGKRKRVPWGISESGYYRFDQQLNYQYRAFGVPGLGFKSDLRKSLVIAPYATLLAVEIFPEKAYKNLQVIRSLGGEGKYGFYEALDFISPAVRERRKPNLIQSFMIHHQGMIIAALNNLLNDNPIKRRFHNEPMIRGSELILEERRPFGVIVGGDGKDGTTLVPGRVLRKKREPRVVKSTSLRYPVAHVLSNNNYTLMITHNGSSISMYKDIVINRWRPSLIQDGYGMFFFIRNMRSKKYWSTTYLPTGIEPDSYRVLFMPDKVEFKRRDGNIETKTEVVVSPQDNLEIRQIVLTNKGFETASLEVTSYFEPVIDTYEADASHPAFSKLFISTEYLEEKKILLATRRPRLEESERKYVFHTVAVKGRLVGEIEHETDRNLFIGRDGTLRYPKILQTELPLSNAAGSELDSIMSLRVNILLLPGRSAVVSYITGIAHSKEKAIELGTKYQSMHAIEDVFKMALFDSEVEMRYLGVTVNQVNAIQDVVGSIYYPSKIMRAPSEIIEKNTMGQQNLWKFGISGDYPIMVFRINDASQIGTLKDAVLAYGYLRKNGVKLDFVILNEEKDDYFQPLNQLISDTITNRKIYYPNVKKSGIFLLRTRNMTKEEVILLLTTARVVLTGKSSLSTGRIRKFLMEEIPGVYAKPLLKETQEYKDIPIEQEELISFNGIGGFSKDGKEYVIFLRDGINTPAPWINVIANDKFGFIVSASGSGYTWSVNSRENKLSHWSNDPVTDTPSEIIYIRDENTGEFFCPTPLPIRANKPYKIRHGFGYSTFEHNSYGMKQVMTVFASRQEPVKIYRLKMENASGKQRVFSLFFYVEWVLGVSRDQTAPYIVTKMDREANLFTAENTFNTEFKGRVAFISSSETIKSCTGDKGEFIGTKGHYGNPRGLMLKELSNNIGAALDPCGVIKVDIQIDSGEFKEVLFIIGQAENYETAVKISNVSRQLLSARAALDDVTSDWEKVLGQIQVDTPDETMNFLLNGWLLYQVLSCRIRARSAFYQSGGAYGFRDQLQDVMSLFNTMPDLCRRHILKCCSRQFKEGDVQHWWHDDSGKGVRTQITDDMLWLPFVTAAYIECTGDTGILEEEVAYLEAEELAPGEFERFFIPEISAEKESVYNHCIRAIERALRVGERGLPLIGRGDWNDGMDRVGWEGKGESVWLGWFIYKILKDFTPICELKGDTERAAAYKKRADRLLNNIEKNAWDGEWYLRAYFDNGQPLGSRLNSECRIDSISQSWGIISGGASDERAAKAMESLQKYLIKEEEQIIMLLTPPFDKSVPNPGYIKGYLPGIRENGGQYTHAATWNIIAYAKLGEGDMAYKLFRILNPANHAHVFSASMKYRLEPYVMPADVYSGFPYAGSGGWSWYTGSAGWMYQALIRWILGVRRKGDRLFINPVIPREWKEYSLEYRHGETKYFIKVENPDGISRGKIYITHNGQDVTDEGIVLCDDNSEHKIKVIIRA
jgi:cyclic beta-1,2-glucan synthetase